MNSLTVNGHAEAPNRLVIASARVKTEDPPIDRGLSPPGQGALGINDRVMPPDPEGFGGLSFLFIGIELAPLLRAMLIPMVR